MADRIHFLYLTTSEAEQIRAAMCLMLETGKKMGFIPPNDFVRAYKSVNNTLKLPKVADDDDPFDIF